MTKRELNVRITLSAKDERFFETPNDDEIALFIEDSVRIRGVYDSVQVQTVKPENEKK